VFFKKNEIIPIIPNKKLKIISTDDWIHILRSVLFSFCTVNFFFSPTLIFPLFLQRGEKKRQDEVQFERTDH